jgi:hypothetical protein
MKLPSFHNLCIHFIALVVVLLASYQAVHDSKIDTNVSIMMGLVIGHYFGDRSPKPK